MREAPRRVLIIGCDTVDNVGGCFRRALEGHYDVRVFDPDFPTGRSIARSGKKLARLNQYVAWATATALGEPLAATYPFLHRVARSFAPDLVIVSYVQSIPERVIRAFREANRSALVLGVFSDQIANFDRGYCFTAGYDGFFSKDRFIVEKLRAKLGWKNAFYLPQACDPSQHHPVTLTDADRAVYGCDLTLAGNISYFRAAELAPLVGRDFKLWGSYAPRWLHHPILQHYQGRAVHGEEKCRAMTAARIVVNGNHYAEIAGTNKRTFEVAAIGAFQITDTPALGDVFAPDEEVAAFDTQAEMVEKIDYYLARPDLRAEMASRACARAHREHTYEHRWVAMMDALGVRVPATYPIQSAGLAVRAQ